ncbi:MAG: hypothetical protein AAF647_04735 [Pseudomonadota bacterium]
MSLELKPQPFGNRRKKLSVQVREEAAAVARGRPHYPQNANGEANDALARALADPDAWIEVHGTFTKGLEHDAFGRVRGKDLIALVEGLNQAHASSQAAKNTPFPGVYTTGNAAELNVPLFSGAHQRPAKPQSGSRTPESPLSGHVFDLQGADADAVGIPPAPELGSDELIAEMAEVYGAAILRDAPFSEMASKAKKVAKAIADLPFFKNETTGQAERRRKARGAVSAKTLFDGSTPGSKEGPYISQFMLAGSMARSSLQPDQLEVDALDDPQMAAITTDAQPLAAPLADSEALAARGISGPATPQDGFIRYGVQAIDQRFIGHLENFDHMTEWQTWLDVQNGANRRDMFDRYQADGAARFPSTPRDLATYVHFDELEQAYRNAALLLLASGQPTDRGLPEGNGHPTRAAFATFGGPHILSLVGEVSSRALKAVRRQKFNYHLRARPEVVAAGIALAWTGGEAAESLGSQRAAFERMADELNAVGLLEDVAKLNQKRNKEIWDAQYAASGGADLGPLTPETNALLPMAFPEGSPMHAAYGAGHATVAGACVTVLKAFFEMFDTMSAPPRAAFGIYDIIKQHAGYPGTFPAHLFGDKRLINGGGEEFVQPEIYEADPANDAKVLRPVPGASLTIQGELDKLAANISIGRNFAGVHYYTDYFESIRLGERVAVSMLQEHMLTYREPVSMRFTSFDGDSVMIVGTGGSEDQNDALVLVWDAHGNGGTEAAAAEWWGRHV